MNAKTDKEHIQGLTFKCGCCDEIFRIKEVKVCPFCGCANLEKPSSEDFEKFYQKYFTRR